MPCVVEAALGCCRHLALDDDCKGFHRVRHFGLFANGVRAANLAKARELLGVKPPPEAMPSAPVDPEAPRLHRGRWPRRPPSF